MYAGGLRVASLRPCTKHGDHTMTRALCRVLFLAAALTLADAAPLIAQVPPQSTADAIRAEVERLRTEFDALRKQYDERLSALERRLAGVEGQVGLPPAAPPASTTQATAEVPAGAAGAGGPTGSLPLYGNPSVLSKIFNPDLAVIGDFLGAAGRNPVEDQPALEMHEAEASFQAIVDPYARADFFIAFGPEGVEIEEGFITFTTLPGSLLLKAGKMRGAFGKVNTLHNHVLPWVDRPLVTRNLVGGEEGISDAGISVSRLLLNPFVFLEATGEVYRGDSAMFRSYKRQDLTYVGRLRGYRDITEATNLDLGASIAFGHNDAGMESTTRLIGLDATFRYRPLRRSIYRRLQARTELVWSRREKQDAVRVVDQPVLDLDLSRLTLPHSASAFGFYASGEYQFARRWFVGGRYDYAERARTGAAADKSGSFLVTYWPSEFGQVRGQYRRTRYAEDVTANEFLFQFLFSIGAHGAHPF